MTQDFQDLNHPTLTSMLTRTQTITQSDIDTLPVFTAERDEDQVTLRLSALDTLDRVRSGKRDMSWLQGKIAENLKNRTNNMRIRKGYDGKFETGYDEIYNWVISRLA
jgi:hypothetical protein